MTYTWNSGKRRYDNYYPQVPIVRSVENVSSEELTSPAIELRINNTLQRESLSVWEKSFLISIGQHFAIKKSLSQGQFSSLVKIESKFSEQKLQDQSNFSNSFTADMRADMRLLAAIYEKNNTLYFGEFRAKVLSDVRFIPTKIEWDRFMGSKYAKGYIENAKSAPKFSIGMVVCPSSIDKSKDYERAIIIDNTSEIPNTYATGGKMYIVLPYGAKTTKLVQERMMKNSK